jgi:antitoxin MazE
MQINKWGNSLAVRLPSAVVERLGLKEGDDIRIDVADPHHFRIARDTRRDDALAALADLGWNLPDGYRFSRDDAHERGV